MAGAIEKVLSKESQTRHYRRLAVKKEREANPAAWQAHLEKSEKEKATREANPAAWKAHRQRSDNQKRKKKREADPELMKAYKAVHATGRARKKAKCEADPKLMEAHKEGQATGQATRKAKLEAHPELMKADKATRHERNMQRSDELMQRSMERAMHEASGLDGVSRDTQVVEGAAFLISLIHRILAQATREGKVAVIQCFYASPKTMYSETRPEAFRPYMTRDVRRGLPAPPPKGTAP